MKPYFLLITFLLLLCCNNANNKKIEDTKKEETKITERSQYKKPEKAYDDVSDIIKNYSLKED